MKTKAGGESQFRETTYAGRYVCIFTIMLSGTSGGEGCKPSDSCPGGRGETKTSDSPCVLVSRV